MYCRATNVFQNFSETVGGDEPEEVSAGRSVQFATETVDGNHDVADFKMNLMGTNCDNASSGPAVHDLVAKTWSSIFTNGLSKENVEALRKKYPVPQNLLLAKASSLNTEVRQAIPLTSIKRDEYQTVTQGLVGATIAAQAQLMTELLKPEEQWNSKLIFEAASDAGRLISYIQYHMSNTRRSLITPMLTTSARNALDVSPIDKQRTIFEPNEGCCSS